MKMSWPKLILFGDSITQFSFGEGGWGASLADMLQRKCDVINRGFSGYNTTWARIIFDKCFPKETMSEVAMVTVFLGANDAALKEMNSIQYVSLDDYRENIKAIVQYLLDRGLSADQIILMTPPPLHETAWGASCMEKYGSPLNRSNSNTGLYAKACSTIAEDSGTGLIDLWTLMQEDKNWQRFLSDGLHFSEEGSQFVSKHLLKMVQDRTEHLPTILPDWKDIDVTCPEKNLL